MKSVARLSFEGGGTLLPARTPYEREVVLEHVELSARRHRRLWFDLDRRTWLVACSPDAPRVCASCSRPCLGLTFVRGTQALCIRCWRVEVVGSKTNRTADVLPLPATPLAKQQARVP